MKNSQFEPLRDYRELSAEEMLERSRQFLDRMYLRRTVRQFSDRPVAREVIENCIRTAATSPSGANMQPWHFVVVSDDSIKRRIREAAELEESKFYHEVAPQEWLDALAPIGTDEHKPFLEVAPYLIVVMAQSYSVDADQNKAKHYYVSESVGIATGFFDCVRTQRRSCVTDSHAQPDGVPKWSPAPSQKRTAVLDIGGWISCLGCRCASAPAKRVQRSCDVCVVRHR